MNSSQTPRTSTLSPNKQFPGQGISGANGAKPNRPVAKFKAGPIMATIWANSAKGVTGDMTYHSVNLDRRYQDKNGAWQSTSSMRVNDLPKAALVLQKAFEFLVMKENESPAATPAPTPAYDPLGPIEEEVLIA